MSCAVPKDLLLLRLRVDHPDVKLLQLLLRDGPRRAHHQVDRPLRLREGDDVADVVETEDEHRDAVDAERDAAVGRSAVFEGLEQEAEAVADVVVAEAKQLKSALVVVLRWVPVRPAADLEAVEAEVVGLRLALS